ncbi:MAG TPA: dihydropteroate synthase, partial [Longimicrobiales bacterium]|nr:dihydropteroate synthase [Longimicrobiales bacterium]
MAGGSPPSALPGAAAARVPDTPPPSRSESPAWHLPRGALSLDRPRIMGILNLTPDSFSDGGELASVDDALLRAEAMVAAGAGILDVGGESTRPGAPEVPADVEMRRILPFLRAAAGRLPVPISVDTRKAEVARAAVDAGASIVNDVSGLAHDPAMAPTVAELGVGVVIMHMRGTPRTMVRRTDYGDVVEEVMAELSARVRSAREAGVDRARIVVDPGIGFAKTPE